MADVIGAIAVIVVIAFSIWQVFIILDFFHEVPKQLKRIADALEKRNKDG